MKCDCLCPKKSGSRGCIGYISSVKMLGYIPTRRVGVSHREGVGGVFSQGGCGGYILTGRVCGVNSHREGVWDMFSQGGCVGYILTEGL